jgi:hypothetical protein
MSSDSLVPKIGSVKGFMKNFRSEKRRRYVPFALYALVGGILTPTCILPQLFPCA